MRRIRVIHRLRTAAALIGFLLILGAAVTLWWANHTGLPDSWRAGIEQALARQGVYAEVESLRYLPLRGIEAGSVTVFTDSTQSRVLGKFRELLLDVDRTKITRGEFRIDRLDLSGASISLAADPTDAASKTLDLTELRGRMEFSGGRGLMIRGASGMVGGIRVALNGDILLFRSGSTSSQAEANAARAQRQRLLRAVIETLERFELDQSSPPRIRADISGDLEQPQSFKADLLISSNQMRSRDLQIQRMEIRAEIRNQTLVVHQAEIDSTDGRLNGKAEMDLRRRQGRFAMRSDIDLAEIITKLRLPLPEIMPTFGRPPIIDVKGHFGNSGDGWSYQVMGLVDLIEPALLHYSADRIKTSFSWDGKRLLLEDFLLNEGPRSLTGRAFITPELVRYQASGNLSVPFVQKTLRIEPLATVLKDFSATELTEAQGTFRGQANPKDPTDWSFDGSFEAREISYRDVPARFARVDLDMEHDLLDFNKGEVEFDYTDYPLRTKHDGPDTGRVKVEAIRYDHQALTVEIDSLEGQAWPAPIIRTFAADVADQIEDYAFHRPPTLKADGTIGAHEAHPKQDMVVRFASPAAIDYEFLDEELTLQAPEGRVTVLPREIQVDQLSVGAFEGLVRLKFTAPITDSQSISGEIDWTDLSLLEISEAYQFESSPAGMITGRLEFNLEGESVGGLNGEGHIALEEAELFDVPIFGPLSPVIATVLGNRKAGFQEAQSAFCSFKVKAGVFATEDFLTTTPSLVFTGDGQADLVQEELNMTIRMNARGFLGIITLPLRPFYGLFQFRGSGPIEKPVWKNVMFTSPPPAQKENLLTPPKAKVVPRDPDDRTLRKSRPTGGSSRISPPNR